MYTVFFYFLREKKQMLSWYVLMHVEDTEGVTRSDKSKDKQKNMDKRTDIELNNRTLRSKYLTTRTPLKTGCGLN